VTGIALAAVLVLAALPARAQEKQLLFEAPEGANDSDRTKAAKNLAARCVAAGMKGVSGDAWAPAPDTPKRVRIISPTGFPEDRIAEIEYFASIPCSSVELHFKHFLAHAEKETFKEGEKAPKGSTWRKVACLDPVSKPFRHFKTLAEDWMLVRDKPVLEIEGKFKIHRHTGGDLYGHERERGIFLKISGASARTMFGQIRKRPDPPRTEMLPVMLMIDGFHCPTDNGFIGWRTLKRGKDEPPDLALWMFPDLNERGPLIFLLENPMPFALKRIQ
jgi:hypothetical protein